MGCRSSLTGPLELLPRPPEPPQNGAGCGARVEREARGGHTEARGRFLCGPQGQDERHTA